MDHIRVLRRAFNITWAYKALWVFGVLLALTAGGRFPNGNNSRYTVDGAPGGGIPPVPNWPRDWPQIPNIPQNIIASMAWIAAAVVCLVVVLVIVFAILRYVANTALIRMVDRNEATGEKMTVREGFRLGWSRAAFRTWVVGLLFGLGGFIFVIATLLIVAAPQLLWLTGDNTAGIIGVVITVGLFILALLLWIVVFAAISILSEMIDRAIILENLGIMDGIRRGWVLFRARLGDSVIMGLILFGLRLALTILLIPVVIALLLGGLVIAGLPALLAGGITNIFVHGNTPQVVAVAVGLPIFLLVMLAPLLWITGLWETYKSSTWTLTFRELLALNAVRPAVEA